MAKPGDHIKIITDKKDFLGILMPNESDSSVFIKLDNGYNMGINKKKIKKIECIKNKKESKELLTNPKKNKNKKNILILHTGGTIASKVDYESGGVIAKFSAQDLISMVPELGIIANFDSELVANMMSEDMNFKDHKKIITAIKKQINNYDGIIIGHGTDTLTFTAASLAFAIDNPKIPIILVGSQRSSDRGSSDAALNLICAAQFIIKSNYQGIAICMHNSSNDDSCVILPATKTRKMHTSRRDAFKAINTDPIAILDSKGQITNYIKQVSKTDKLTIKDSFSDKVALIKVHPNLDTTLLEFITKNYEGIVFEGTGLGHLPTNTKDNEKNYEIIRKFISKGGIVAITSQCLYGRVHPNVYTNLRRLSQIGCIFCEDMLPETAFIKLSWLLGNYSKEQAKDFLPKNLRGEITERSLYKKDYLE